jgi:hypothetical protein
MIVLALLLGMIMLKPVWRFVEYPFNEIQMPYRLGSYLFYTAAALVLIAALALQRFAARGGSPGTVRALRIALAGSVAISLALCLWQLWVPSTRFGGSYANRAEALRSATAAPNSWYAIGDYGDWHVTLATAPRNRLLIIPPRAVQGDRFDAWMDVPPGPLPIQTNIVGGSYLVHIGGLRIVGRNPEDLAVVKREGGGSGPVHVVVETTHSAVVELGRAASLIALLVVLAILIYAGVHARRVRRTSTGPDHRTSEIARDMPAL